MNLTKYKHPFIKFWGTCQFLGNGSIYSPGPEYDDPANCAPEDEQYGSQYGGYGAPYDQYGSRSSIGRRSLGSLRIQQANSSPEPPPPPPRNHDPSFNDSKDSNEISEAECDRDQLITSRNYGGELQSIISLHIFFLSWEIRLMVR